MPKELGRFSSVVRSYRGTGEPASGAVWIHGPSCIGRLSRHRWLKRRATKSIFSLDEEWTVKYISALVLTDVKYIPALLLSHLPMSERKVPIVASNSTWHEKNLKIEKQIDENFFSSVDQLAIRKKLGRNGSRSENVQRCRKSFLPCGTLCWDQLMKIAFDGAAIDRLDRRAEKKS